MSAFLLFVPLMYQKEKKPPNRAYFDSLKYINTVI